MATTIVIDGARDNRHRGILKDGRVVDSATGRKVVIRFGDGEVAATLDHVYCATDEHGDVWLEYANGTWKRSRDSVAAESIIEHREDSAGKTRLESRGQIDIDQV